MSRLPYFKFFLADVSFETRGFDPQERAAYFSLMMRQWGYGPLPDDDALLAKFAEVRPDVWRRISPTLRRVFTPTEDGKLALAWLHKQRKNFSKTGGKPAQEPAQVLDPNPLSRQNFRPENAADLREKDPPIAIARARSPLTPHGEGQSPAPAAPAGEGKGIPPAPTPAPCERGPLPAAPEMAAEDVDWEEKLRAPAPAAGPLAPQHRAHAAAGRDPGLFDPPQEPNAPGSPPMLTVKTGRPKRERTQSKSRDPWPKPKPPRQPPETANGHNVLAVVDKSCDILDVGAGAWFEFEAMIGDMLTEGASPERHIYPVMREAKRMMGTKYQPKRAGWFALQIRQKLMGMVA